MGNQAIGGKSSATGSAANMPATDRPEVKRLSTPFDEVASAAPQSRLGEIVPLLPGYPRTQVCRVGREGFSMQEVAPPMLHERQLTGLHSPSRQTLRPATTVSTARPVSVRCS
jgi:hypothetical protein